MTKRSIYTILLFISSAGMPFYGFGQKKQATNRPKVVIGLVIDQMRWDYLYRYQDRYVAGGFKRLLRDGFNCQNTFINYIPSFTGPGHTCIYTGSVPSIHGIASNDWIELSTGKKMYCVDDATEHPASDPSGNRPSMSPRNLQASTITDELRLATNKAARVYGVAIKDRSCILPAGHMANGAYWMDDSTGTFGTSTYYPEQNPAWLQQFNNRHLADSLMNTNWETLYPIGTYTQSLPDDNAYEKGFKGEKAPVFPHNTNNLSGKQKYNTLKTMPAGNTLTLMLAKACMKGAQLGKGSTTDFLAVSLSSTDYTGHQFGPNSVEIEDAYLRLDKDLADLLNWLDAEQGAGNYLLFLTADHGGAHNAQYLMDEKVPGGFVEKSLGKDLDAYLSAQYGTDSLVAHLTDYQVYPNEAKISAAKLNRSEVLKTITTWLAMRPEVGHVLNMTDLGNCTAPDPIRTMAINGYNAQRSGSILIIPKPGWYEGYAKTGTTHGTWNPYDSHIPLIWYGWQVKPGETYAEVHMTDISATLAAMLHIQMPSGCVGKVIEPVLRK